MRALIRPLLASGCILTFGRMLHAQAATSNSHDHAAMATQTATSPGSSGQSAFATLSEIRKLLEADPSTDWRRVNLDALRAHLVDMDLVMLQARSQRRALAGGVQFDITGSGAVVGAIQRMTLAHAGTISEGDGFSMTAVRTPTGARVTVRPLTSGDDAMLTRLSGLGFFGLLTLGDHHGAHHLAMARGDAMHAHPASGHQEPARR